MANQDPDAGLIARVGCGDAAATRLLVVAKLPRVLGLATRLLGDRVEAEDIAQEAFVRVWKHAARWQPDRALFDTWLHKIVLNLCRDRLRQRRPALGQEMPEVADPTEHAEESLLDRERQQAVAAAISALPDRQREAIILVHYQDLGGVEAAAVLNVSIEALESLLARGRRALRAHFAEEGARAL